MGQVELEARELVQYQLPAQPVLQRERVRQAQEGQPASLEARSAQVRLSAVRVMYSFANQACSGAWARRCDLSAEQWNNTTARNNRKRAGQRVNQEKEQGQGALRQAVEHAPAIRDLILGQVVARRLAIRHLVNELAH